jgi:predicted alpha/beta superfamily hydrolase
MASQKPQNLYISLRELCDLLRPLKKLKMTSPTFYKSSLLLLIILIGFSVPAQNTITQALHFGESHRFYSSILEQERTIHVYLPPSYSPDSARSYPIVYLLDGGLDQDFIHISGLTQFSSFPWIDRMPECIVVGIENIDRYHDFTSPCNIAEYLELNPTNGGLVAFIGFLETELIPLVETLYPCQERKTLIGQSLGGLLACEILLKKPQMFQNFLIVSPSLWWNEEALLELEIPPFKEEKRIFMAVGNEGPIMKKLARKMSRKLKHAQQDMLSVNFEYYSQLDHGDALHLSAYDGLAFLFANHRKDPQ